MITKFKIFEKESTDKIWSEKAILFYNDLAKVLKDNKDMLRDAGQGSYYIEAKYINEKYDDLIILFLHNEDSRLKKGVFDKYDTDYAYGHIDSGRPVILCNNLIEPNNTEHMNTRLNRTQFIHEFIHYTDEKFRYKNNHKGENTMKSEKDYFNSPSEFNSYYHDGSFSVRNFFKDDGHLTALKKWNMIFKKDDATFIEFKSKISKFFHTQWIENMNIKYTKKFNKRLFDLYSTIKSELNLI